MLSFFAGLLEGPVVFAQDLGWFFLAAFGLPLLVAGFIQGYAPWHIGKLNRVSQIASLLLWVTLLLVYDFVPGWQKGMMIASVTCWVAVLVIFFYTARLAFRDGKKENQYVEP